MENSRSLRGFVEKLEDVTGFQFKLVDSPSSVRFFQLYCNDGSEVDVFDEDADRVLLVLEDARGTREYKIRKSSLAIADTIVSKFVKEHGGSEWEHPSRRAVEIEKRKGIGYAYESRRRPGRLIKESDDNAIKNVFWEVLDIGVDGEDDWEKVEEKEDEDDKTYTSVHQLLDKFKRYGEPEEVVVRRGANIGWEIDVDEIDDVLNKPEQYEVNLFIPKGKNRECRVNLFFDVVPNSMIRRTR